MKAYAGEIKKAVIPAAGLGTRFLPITKAQPKEMLPVFNKPTIQYVVEEIIDSGINDILIITGKNKRAIEDHFDRSLELEISLKGRGKESFSKDMERIAGVDIHYIRQREQRGLGDAVLCAKKYVGSDPFAVLLGDTITVDEAPCTSQMMEVFARIKSSVIAVENVPREQISKYGVVAVDEIENGLYKIRDLVEKPDPDEAPSNFGIIGRYILTPRVFSCIEKTEPGKGGEVQLTDALRLLKDEAPLYAFEYIGKRYDIGNLGDWLKSSVELALKDESLGDELRDFLRDVVG